MLKIFSLTIKISIIVVSFLLFSCEKVIDVDLNEADPAIVIEGNLSHADNHLEVSISKTGSYFGTSEPVKVPGAVVTLEDESGTRIEAEEKGDGLYGSYQVYTIPGEEYRLNVEVEGTVYSAVSELNHKPEIDSLGYELYNGSRFLDSGYRLNVYFSDPAGEENYYRIKIYKNGDIMDRVNDLIVFDDSGINGKSIEVTLRGQIFEDGDTAYVEMLSIDELAWRYFTTFKEAADINPGSPAPANPVTNFNNGALGYFSAWSHDSGTIIIKKDK